MSSYSLPQTFHTRSHRAAAVLIWTVGIGLTSWVGMSTSFADVLPWAVVCGTLSLWSWVLLWHPHVRVTRDYVDIVNPFVRCRVLAQSISEVSTQYQYAVVVDGRRRYAWALPAPGFLAVARMGMRHTQQTAGPLTREGQDAQVRPGDVAGSACSTASEVTRSILSAQPETDETSVVTTVNWWLVGITTVMTLSVALL